MGHRAEQIIHIVTDAGASAAGIVRVGDIRCYPALLELCEMNSCGRYGSSWACPPGCGSPKALFARLSSFSAGVVFQQTARLEDPFDYARMMQAGQAFSSLGHVISERLAHTLPEYCILGAGGCDICPACTYPGAPCRHPGRVIPPLEACGVNVAELCALAGLQYIYGPDSVTYTGLLAFDPGVEGRRVVKIGAVKLSGKKWSR